MGAVSGFNPEDIERATLSCMMQWPDCYGQGVEQLTPQHFQSPAMRIVFEELIALYERNIPYDMVLFNQHLEVTNKLARIGGMSVTAELLHFAHSPKIWDYYVELLDEAIQRRLFVQISEEGITRVEKQDQDAIPDALTKLSELSFKRQTNITFTAAVADKINRMEFGEPDADIIKTGIAALDTHSPLRKGDMPLIAGERKAGKSVLSLTIATNIAKNGIPVLYFSLEDRIPKVIDRVFAGVSRVPMNKHHVQKLNDSDMSRCIDASSKLGKMPLTIRDDCYDLAVILSAMRRAVAREEAGLIVVDYAQLVRAKADTRREEVEKVSREFRLAAMELKVPLILLCQLNKDGETRESKALEMDATAMWLISPVEDEPSQRIIDIPWQRNGESAISFPVAFFGDIARVENAAPQYKAA